MSVDVPITFLFHRKESVHNILSRKTNINISMLFRNILVTIRKKRCIENAYLWVTVIGEGEGLARGPLCFIISLAMFFNFKNCSDILFLEHKIKM